MHTVEIALKDQCTLIKIQLLMTTTTGNTIDLATTSNFNVRWDGGSTGIYFRVRW